LVGGRAEMDGPRETTRNAEASDELFEAYAIPGILWKEGTEGVFEPETGKNSRCSVT
jgi:hypothetical protein